MKNYVILNYDCSNSYLSSNFAAVREYIYYIMWYLCRCPNMRYFRRVGLTSHFQRRIVLDVMSCLISSYLFLYSKSDRANSCPYA